MSACTAEIERCWVAVSPDRDENQNEHAHDANVYEGVLTLTEAMVRGRAGG